MINLQIIIDSNSLQQVFMFGGKIGGLQTRLKALLFLAVAAIGGWWFFAKLGVTGVQIPFFDTLHLGWLIIPLFILVVFATGVAVNMSDGLDGLAGGLSAIAFGAYAIIAIIEKKYGIAGFCMTVVGTLLSYLSRTLLYGRCRVICARNGTWSSSNANRHCIPTSCDWYSICR
jgi:hypothetical protein